MITGESAPLDASMRRNGVNYSVYSRSIAFTAELQGEKMLLHLILNAYWELLEFELLQGEDGASWRRLIDTVLASPQDIVPWQESPAIPSRTYRAEPRSVVVLFSQTGTG